MQGPQGNIPRQVDTKIHTPKQDASRVSALITDLRKAPKVNAKQHQVSLDNCFIVSKNSIFSSGLKLKLPEAPCTKKRNEKGLSQVVATINQDCKAMGFPEEGEKIINSIRGKSAVRLMHLQRVPTILAAIRSLAQDVVIYDKFWQLENFRKHSIVRSVVAMSRFDLDPEALKVYAKELTLEIASEPGILDADLDNLADDIYERRTKSAALPKDGASSVIHPTGTTHSQAAGIEKKAEQNTVRLHPCQEDVKSSRSESTPATSVATHSSANTPSIEEDLKRYGRIFNLGTAPEMAFLAQIVMRDAGEAPEQGHRALAIEIARQAKKECGLSPTPATKFNQDRIEPLLKEFLAFRDMQLKAQ